MSNATKTARRFSVESCDSKMHLFQQLLNIGLIGENGKLVENLPTFKVSLIPDSPWGALAATLSDHLHVQGVTAKDGSGNCWMINGHYPTYAPDSNPGSRRGGRFEGFIDTRTRKGWIEVTF